MEQIRAEEADRKRRKQERKVRRKDGDRSRKKRKREKG